MKKIAFKHSNEIRRILLKHIHGSRTKVYLFGSRVSGAGASGSDVDIALDSASPISEDLLFCLRTEFEESEIPYEIDLVDLSRANVRFRTKVLKSGLEWTLRC